MDGRFRKPEATFLACFVYVLLIEREKYVELTVKSPSLENPPNEWVREETIHME